MKLSDLTAELRPITRLGPATDPTVKQIAVDSRAVTAGSLFIAVPGEHRDGHDFICEAASRGACAIVAERAAARVQVPIVLVANARRALAQLAAKYYGSPARHMDITAITGTIGKTSTSLILKQILHNAGDNVGVIGSLGIQDGRSLQNSVYTTPDALTLQKALGEMRSNQVKSVVMEVSSHALAQDRTYGLKFSCITMTNLFPLEHLEYHPTFNHYMETKAQILRQVGQNGVVVYNGDDANLCDVVRSYRGFALSFGFRDGVDVQVRHLKTAPEGSTFDLRLNSQSLRQNYKTGELLAVHVPLPGHNNVSNALAAIATALSQNIDPYLIRSALSDLRPFKRRMERLQFANVTVIDDTAGHPRSFEQLFEYVAALDPPSPKLLVAIRGGRGPKINQANATMIAQWYNKLPLGSVWVTASDDVVNEKDRVSTAERDAYLNTLRKAQVPFVYVPHLKKAVDAVVRTVAEIDLAESLIILAGAQGMDCGAQMIRESLNKTQPEYRHQPL